MILSQLIYLQLEAVQSRYCPQILSSSDWILYFYLDISDDGSNRTWDRLNML
jgi:hypothetical protein